MFEQLCRITTEQDYRGKKFQIRDFDKCIDLTSEVSLEGFFSKPHDPFLDKVVSVLEAFEPQINKDVSTMHKHLTAVMAVGKDAYTATLNKKPDLNLFKKLGPDKRVLPYHVLIEGVEDQKLFTPYLRSILTLPLATTADDIQKFYRSIDQKSHVFSRFAIFAQDSHPIFESISKSELDDAPYAELGYPVNFPNLFLEIGKTTEQEAVELFTLKSELIGVINKAIVFLKQTPQKTDEVGARCIHRQIFSMYNLYYRACRCVWWDYYDHGVSVAKKIATCYK